MGAIIGYASSDVTLWTRISSNHTSNTCLMDQDKDGQVRIKNRKTFVWT